MKKLSNKFFKSFSTICLLAVASFSLFSLTAISKNNTVYQNVSKIVYSNILNVKTTPDVNTIKMLIKDLNIDNQLELNSLSQSQLQTLQNWLIQYLGIVAKQIDIVRKWSFDEFITPIQSLDYPDLNIDWTSIQNANQTILHFLSKSLTWENNKQFILSDLSFANLPNLEQHFSSLIKQDGSLLYYSYLNQQIFNITKPIVKTILDRDGTSLGLMALGFSINNCGDKKKCTTERYKTFLLNYYSAILSKFKDYIWTEIPTQIPIWSDGITNNFFQPVTYTSAGNLLNQKQENWDGDETADQLIAKFLVPKDSLNDQISNWFDEDFYKYHIWEYKGKNYECSIGKWLEYEYMQIYKKYNLNLYGPYPVFTPSTPYLIFFGQSDINAILQKAKTFKLLYKSVLEEEANHYISDYKEDIGLGWSYDYNITENLLSISSEHTWFTKKNENLGNYDEKAVTWLENALDKTVFDKAIHDNMEVQFAEQHNGLKPGAYLQSQITKVEHSINTHGNSLEAVLKYADAYKPPNKYYLDHYNGGTQSFAQYLQAKSDEYAKKFPSPKKSNSTNLYFLFLLLIIPIIFIFIFLINWKRTKKINKA